MDESTRGDEAGPAEARKAGPSEANAESPAREAAGGAISAEMPQAPHPASQSLERHARQDESAADPAARPEVGEHGLPGAAADTPVLAEAPKGPAAPADAVDVAADPEMGVVEPSLETGAAEHDIGSPSAQRALELPEPHEAVADGPHEDGSPVEAAPRSSARPEPDQDAAIAALEAEESLHDVNANEPDAGERPSELSGQPVAPESTATGEEAAGDAESDLTSEIPSHETIAPDPETSPPPQHEIASHEPPAVISGPTPGEPAADVEYEPVARPEPVAPHDAAISAASEPDAPRAASREHAAIPVQPDAPAADEAQASQSTEPPADAPGDARFPAQIKPDPSIASSSAPVEAPPSRFHVSAALDAFAVQPAEPSSHSSGAGPDGPPDELTELLREEQIWSGPEAVEPGVQRSEPQPIDAYHHAPGGEVHADTATNVQQHSPRAALLTNATTLARPAAGWRRLSAAWPSVAVPSPSTAGSLRYYLHLAARLAAALVVIFTTTMLLLVLLYRWVDPPTSTLMLGQRLAGVEIDQRWVPLQRISPYLIHAVILSEDGGFCRHHGVDWSALEEAIEDSRGGSTITMQVVKNLFLWPARSYVRKALEMVLAYVVEIVWPKERVLEVYLNIAEWGPGVFGAEAAARQHFGKRASRLTAQEAALLAVALPSPIERRAGRPNWQTRRLANNLLIRMRAVRAPFRCVRGAAR